MNYGLLALMLGIGILLLAGVSIIAVGTTMNDLSVPTEEKCQSIYGYGSAEKIYAEKYFCEFNETGWHLNKTKFKKAFNNIDAWTT